MAETKEAGLILRASCTYQTNGTMVEVMCYSDGLYNHRVVIIIPGVMAKQEDFVDWHAKEKSMKEDQK